MGDQAHHGLTMRLLFALLALTIAAAGGGVLIGEMARHFASSQSCKAPVNAPQTQPSIKERNA